MKCFTAGYGGRVPADFVAILVKHGVATVADVRIHPERASMGSYALARSPDKGIRRLLADAGIGYVSLRALGNPFKDEPDWQERYERYLRDDLEAMLAPLGELREPICLLCAEKRFESCHRAQIARALAERGASVVHLE